MMTSQRYQIALQLSNGRVRILSSHASISDAAETAAWTQLLAVCPDEDQALLLDHEMLWTDTTTGLTATGRDPYQLLETRQLPYALIDAPCA